MKVKYINKKGAYKQVIGVQLDFFGNSHYITISEGGAKQELIPFKMAKIKQEKK